jgi:putative endonuclease
MSLETMGARKKLGSRGEAAVAAYLQEHGFTICCLNYASRLGEVDVIAQGRDVRVFVEVKTRVCEQVPLSALVNYPKQRKIIKTALQYNLVNPPVRECSYRFDVALVVWDGNSPVVNYIPNAFVPSGEEYL